MAAPQEPKPAPHLEGSFPKKRSESAPEARVRMELDGFSANVRETMARFDQDQDGHIDANELQSMVNNLVEERLKGRFLRNAVLALTLGCLLLCGGIFGLTWAVVKTQKDMGVSAAGVMVATDGGGVVLARNVDLGVSGGQLVVATAGVDGNSSRPLSTATALWEAQFSAAVNFDRLQTLRRLLVSSTTAAGAPVELLLAVTGVSKLRSDAAAPGAPAVRIVTPLGVASLRGAQLAMDDALAKVAADTGMEGLSRDAASGTTVVGGARSMFIGGFDAPLTWADCLAHPNSSNSDSDECWLG